MSENHTVILKYLEIIESGISDHHIAVLVVLKVPLDKGNIKAKFYKGHNFFVADILKTDKKNTKIQLQTFS